MTKIGNYEPILIMINKCINLNFDEKNFDEKILMRNFNEKNFDGKIVTLQWRSQADTTLIRDQMYLHR